MEDVLRIGTGAVVAGLLGRWAYRRGFRDGVQTAVEQAKRIINESFGTKEGG